jgi:hypothetical protein
LNRFSSFLADTTDWQKKVNNAKPVEPILKPVEPVSTRQKPVECPAEPVFSREQFWPR